MADKGRKTNAGKGMVDILGLETALRAATTIIKIVFVFVFSEEFRPHLLSNDTPQDSFVIITIFSFLLGSILGYLVFQRSYCLRALLYPFGLDGQSSHF